jgi:hypothetical protein
MSISFDDLTVAIKRVMQDAGVYTGVIDPVVTTEYTNAWRSYCGRTNGAVFTSVPDIGLQPLAVQEVILAAMVNEALSDFKGVPLNDSIIDGVVGTVLCVLEPEAAAEEQPEPAPEAAPTEVPATEAKDEQLKETEVEVPEETDESTTSA